MLGIGSQVLGAARSVGFEIDESAAAIARNNIEEFEVEMEIVMGDVLEAQFEPEFDTVLLNPPFGTKPGNRGIDMKFLRQAVQLSKYRVYSSTNRQLEIIFCGLSNHGVLTQMLLQRCGITFQRHTPFIKRKVKMWKSI